MSYLHCHTKGCDWSQDDFWSWDWSGLKRFWKWKYRPFGYNPFSLILEDIASYWMPRRINFDKWWAEEHKCSRTDPHSWWLIRREIIKDLKKFKYQKWWTYDSWKKDYDAGKAVCPDCGRSDQFDID